MEIQGHNYRFNKIAPLPLWHATRRLAPALLGGVGLANLAKARSENGINLKLMMSSVEPFLDALGKMPDEDSEYVINTFLSVVERDAGGDRGWQKVGTADALMYQDINLAILLRLVFEAARENLEGFFDAALSMFQGQGGDQT